MTACKGGASGFYHFYINEIQATISIVTITTVTNTTEKTSLVVAEKDLQPQIQALLFFQLPDT